MKRFLNIALLGAGLVLFQASSARADLIEVIDGTDCSGEFGQGFENCEIPTEYDPNNSPVIAKYDVTGDDWEINSALFPTIDGSEFTIDLANNTWSYNPGAGDPIVTFFVVKGANEFGLYSNGGDLLSDSWGAPFLTNESHLTFYDTGNVIPEPASLVLFGTGLTGLMAARRRRKANKQ